MVVMPYYIIVYDINVKRLNKVREFLRLWLFREQNSVFEGELTEAQFFNVYSRLQNMINKKEDQIIIYEVKNKKNLKRKIIGKHEYEENNII